jgi:hypothetical protein
MYRQPSGVLASVIPARPLLILSAFAPSPTRLGRPWAARTPRPAQKIMETAWASCLSKALAYEAALDGAMDVQAFPSAASDSLR